MMNETYSDIWLTDVLKRARRIAVVGASSNPARPSFFVSHYLREQGYEIYPVNPKLTGEFLFGRTVVASLSEIRDTIDVIDIFRRAEYVPWIVEEALNTFQNKPVIWMQIGIAHQESAEKARAAGVDVVMNRCTKVEHQRLLG